MPLNVASSAGARNCVLKKEVDAKLHGVVNSAARTSTGSKERSIVNSQNGEAWQSAGSDRGSEVSQVDPEVYKRLDAQIRALRGVKDKAEETPQQKMEHRLNIIIGGIIGLNAVIMAMETDLKPDDAEATLEDKVIWIVLESSFCIIFAAEIAIRVYWAGCSWFWSLANMVDTGLVLIMMLDTWILSFISSGAAGGVGMVAVLRVARLARLVRLLRIVRMCRGFYTMACAFWSALKSMVWLCLMMCVGLFLFALFTTTFIGKNEEFKELDMGGWTGRERFGTVFRSMYSLFELMTLEGWTQVGRPLIHLQPGMFFFLFLFIMIFTFGLLNMIVAMVVEATIDQKKSLEALHEQEQSEKFADQLEALKTVFQMADTDMNGLLSSEEFEVVFEDERARSALDFLHMPIDDARALYEVLDFNEPYGQIDVAEFVDGCAKLRGLSVANTDIIATHAVVRSIKNGMTKVQQRLGCDSKTDNNAKSRPIVEEELLQRLDNQSTMQKQILEQQSHILKRLDQLAAGQDKLAADQADVRCRLDIMAPVLAQRTEIHPSEPSSTSKLKCGSEPSAASKLHTRALDKVDFAPNVLTRRSSQPARPMSASAVLPGVIEAN